jgi:homogentisate 1,2-dioxygenase
VLVGNDDLVISLVAAEEPSGLYRNATGDEVVYVRSGRARLESVYGVLEVDAGDYVVLAMSTTHRWVPLGDEPLRLIVIEAAGHVAFPDRYLSDHGQFLEHAPFCERDLRAPDVPHLVESDEPIPVLVRHRGGLTRYTYRYHPFDVVGWTGCLYPFALSIHDFEPITGRIHQPPPVHQTFAGRGFVVCSFVPRLFDYHPLAVPAPYNHANVDSDELLFYVEGDFMSRKGSGVEAGSVSLHPAGFVHGPQPGSVEASIGKVATEELAVMVDTFRPVRLGPAAFACEDPEYAWTWARGLEAGRGSTF